MFVDDNEHCDNLQPAEPLTVQDSDGGGRPPRTTHWRVSVAPFGFFYLSCSRKLILILICWREDDNPVKKDCYPDVIFLFIKFVPLSNITLPRSKSQCQEVVPQL